MDTFNRHEHYTHLPSIPDALPEFFPPRKETAVVSKAVIEVTPGGWTPLPFPAEDGVHPSNTRYNLRKRSSRWNAIQTASTARLPQAEAESQFQVESPIQAQLEVTHPHQPTYQCTTCNITFTKENTLTKHIIEAHSILRYPCVYPNCSATFSTSHGRKCHEGIVHGEKIYSCQYEDCEKVYKSLWARHQHDERIHGWEWWRCRLCPRRFESEQVRLGHERGDCVGSVDY